MAYCVLLKFIIQLLNSRLANRKEETLYSCLIDSSCDMSLSHSFKLGTLSIKKRIDKIRWSLSSLYRLKKNPIKLYHNLDMVDLVDEHQQPNLKRIQEQYNTSKPP